MLSFFHINTILKCYKIWGLILNLVKLSNFYAVRVIPLFNVLQIVLENGVDTSDASGIKPDVVTEDGQVHQSYTEEQILMAQNTDSQGAEKVK